MVITIIKQLDLFIHYQLALMKKALKIEKVITIGFHIIKIMLKNMIMMNLVAIDQPMVFIKNL